MAEGGLVSWNTEATCGVVNNVAFMLLMCPTYPLPEISYQFMNNLPQAPEWFNVLISVTPPDPTVLAQMGSLYTHLSDKPQAFHHYLESHRYYPSSIPVLSWLGAYYVDNEVYEQAR